MSSPLEYGFDSNVLAGLQAQSAPVGGAPDGGEEGHGSGLPEGDGGAVAGAAPAAGGSPPLGGVAAPVSNRVFVGNLAWSTSWQDLKDHMRQAGLVIYADVFREANGYSKEAAVNAIQTLNDTKIVGTDRLIFVREDRESDSFNKRGPRRVVPPMPAGPPRMMHGSVAGRQIFVGNLPYSVTWQVLKDTFRAAGNVVRADIMIGPNGRRKGQGIVLFASPHDAENAIRMFHNREFGARRMVVHLDRFAQ